MPALGFVPARGRYSNAPNIDVYLKSWEGTSPIVVDRIGRSSLRVEQPSLSLLLAVQPDVGLRCTTKNVQSGLRVVQKVVQLRGGLGRPVVLGALEPSQTGQV